MAVLSLRCELTGSPLDHFLSHACYQTNLHSLYCLFGFCHWFVLLCPPAEARSGAARPLLRACSSGCRHMHTQHARQIAATATARFGVITVQAWVTWREIAPHQEKQPELKVQPCPLKAQSLLSFTLKPKVKKWAFTWLWVCAFLHSGARKSVFPMLAIFSYPS